MCIKISLFKKRKGMSVILATLIFIGILFSAIVPMSMVMNQADTIYEQELKERKTLDDEKADENIMVFAYPPDMLEEKLTISIRNMGGLESKIVRVWINDHYHEEDEMITATNPNIAITYDVDGSEETFSVKAVTERGNIILSSSGNLYYDFSTGVWITPSRAICVNILNQQGKYKIWINEKDGPLISYYESQGTEFEDITEAFLVPEPIQYTVLVEKHSGGWVTVPGTPVDVPLNVEDWSITPIKYVFIDGMTV
jgi:archaellum component FlaF (FlaF/FlaG flagellin family)